MVGTFLSLAGAMLSGCRSSRRSLAAQAALLRNPPRRVFLRGDRLYETLRTSSVWNARKPERRPDVIVQASSVEEVQAAIAFARDNRLKLSLRSGGHHWSAPSLRDEGVLLDVGALRQVLIDPSSKRAVAGPGVPNAELAAQLGEQGLAFPLGHCPTVTLGGYLLGGGFGWNAGAWGVACWNVTGIDLVTAQGALVHASENHNRELFWAARGGGPGFFGVIVGYELQLFDLPRSIETSRIVFPLSQAAEVAAWIDSIAGKLPRNVELTLSYVPAPAEHAQEHERACSVTAHAFADSHEEALAALEPIAACPLKSISTELNFATPFPVLFEEIGRYFQKGKRYAVDSLWLKGNPAELLGQAAQSYSKAPSKDSLMINVVLPPPPADAPPLPDCAFSIVGPVLVNAYAVWDDEAADGANMDWLRSTVAGLSSATIGRYIGEADLESEEAHARHSFSESSWNRLAWLRKKYDPEGLFHGLPSV